MSVFQCVGGDGAPCRPSCIEIGPDCRATIHRCTVASKANGKLVEMMWFIFNVDDELNYTFEYRLD